MGRDLKKFLVFMATGIALVGLLDFVLGTGLDYLHGHLRSGERARAHFAINRSVADVYVFGSSRALYHYYPTILEDTLHMSVYNAGRSAQSVLYDLLVFKMILKRHKPKMVILDLNEGEFVYAPEKYDIVNSLLPYYRLDEGVRQMIGVIKPGYKYFSWSHILPYNSSLFAVLYRSLTSRGERKDIHGYIYMKGHRNSKMENYDCGLHDNYDDRIINALREFVALCRENRIRLLAVTSPRFLNVSCVRQDLQKLKAELASMNVDYLDFSGNTKYIRNPDYMYDEAHLNLEGSVEFTKDIAHYIKQTTH